MVSKLQSGQPRVENDNRGVYFLKSKETVAKARPASVVDLKNLSELNR